MIHDQKPFKNYILPKSGFSLFHPPTTFVEQSKGGKDQSVHPSLIDIETSVESSVCALVKPNPKASEMKNHILALVLSQATPGLSRCLVSLPMV